MARRSPRRIFSDDFKREKVSQLESGEVTVAELVRMYGMHRSAVYVWKNKFGQLPKSERFVVDKDSEYKKNLDLQKRLNSLENMVGRQQMLLDYYDQVISQASVELKIDIEKKVWVEVIKFLLTKTKSYSLEELYTAIGRSRQQYHQQTKRNRTELLISSTLISAVKKWRKRHSSMGSRTMYYSLEASGIEIPIGINKFEKLMSAKNLTVGKVKKYGPKTSDGKGKNAYPNLCNNLIINGINQIIVGDITYYWVDNKCVLYIYIERCI